MNYDSDYPLELTSEEQRLGFEVWEIFGIADLDFPRRWTPVVCKVLGPQDLIVKTINAFGPGFIYNHRRFGWMSSLKRGPGSWCPVVSVLINDPAQAVLEAEIGSDSYLSPPVLGADAQMRKPDA